MPNRVVRIGAVSYLNARPLVLGLEQGLGAGSISLLYDVPSVIADKLAAAEIDIGLIPSIELARIPGLTVVPGLAVTTRGRSRSVLLVSRKPLAEIRSVALDPESRTSNALARILFSRVWGAGPAFVPGSRDLDAALRDHDAAVRIGDKALFEPVPPGATAFDLGDAWTLETDLPFVYAVWACRPGILDRSLHDILQASKRAGCAALERIAADYTWDGRRFPRIASVYLAEDMRYRLGRQELEGLNKFLAAAADLGLAEPLPHVPVASFHPAAYGGAISVADGMGTTK